MGPEWTKPELPKYSLNTSTHRMTGNRSGLLAILEVERNLVEGMETDFPVAI